MNTPVLPESLDQILRSAPLEEALAAVVGHFGCQAGTYHTASEGVLHLAAAHHIPAHICQIVKEVPFGKGIAGLAAERRAPVSICNLQTDESGQARPAAKGTGMEGSLAVPAIDAQGVIKGVLGIAKAQAHDWSEAETALVGAAAAVLAAR